MAEICKSCGNTGFVSTGNPMDPFEQARCQCCLPSDTPAPTSKCKMIEIAGHECIEGHCTLRNASGGEHDCGRDTPAPSAEHETMRQIVHGTTYGAAWQQLAHANGMQAALVMIGKSASDAEGMKAVRAAADKASAEAMREITKAGARSPTQTTAPDVEALIDELVECAKAHRRTFADFMLARQAIQMAFDALAKRVAMYQREILEGEPDPAFVLQDGNYIEMVRSLHAAQKAGLERVAELEAKCDEYLSCIDKAEFATVKAEARVRELERHQDQFQNAAGKAVVRAEGLEDMYEKAKARADKLAAALNRLGSMEAFDGSRAINLTHDGELLARIRYAQATLTEGGDHG